MRLEKLLIKETKSMLISKTQQMVLSIALASLISCSCKKTNGEIFKSGGEKAQPVINPIEVIPGNPSRFGITMDKFIGINGFHEDNINDMQAAGTLRAYCNWDWFQGDNPGDQLIFQNSRGGWYFDDAFRKIKNAGITVSMCFQGAIKNLQGTGTFKFNDKPIDAPNLSTTDPNSYKSISNSLYQIAARYGKTVVSADKLNVPANQKQSGLDLIEYLEVWNEQDKTWEGANAKFSPQEYAAMLSKCYDKIKEADPKMKVVMGGLATLSVDYIKAMKAWFEANRADKKFAADVVNMHLYAFSSTIDWGNPLKNTAECPEQNGFKEKAKGVVDYVRENIPNAQVWISEFGWDTNPNSVLSPKKINDLTMNELQARYIIRGYLAYAAAGIDQAQLFELNDPSQNNISTWYGTSGLTDRTLNFAKKPSWYFTATLKNLLKGMVYLGEQVSGNPDILIYKFKDVTKNNGVYAVWYKTAKDAATTNFQLNIGAKATTATQVVLTDKSITGTATNLKINNGSLTFGVSEKPVFIQVDNIN